MTVEEAYRYERDRFYKCNGVYPTFCFLATDVARRAETEAIAQVRHRALIQSKLWDAEGVLFVIGDQVPQGMIVVGSLVAVPPR